MRFRVWPEADLGHWTAFWLLSGGLFVAASHPARAQSWPGHSHDAQHTSLSGAAARVPTQIRWSTPVDLNPEYSGNELLTHYGSPMITRSNTVLVPVKVGTTATGISFEIQAFRSSSSSGSSPTPLWSYASDPPYSLPPGYNWIPSWGPTLKPLDKAVVFPGAGGTVWVRSFPDSATGTFTQYAFYGLANYNMNPDGFNAAIQICTPITCDSAGNLYFGYVTNGATVAGLTIPSGVARLSNTFSGSYVAAASLSGSSTYNRIVYNCAPAVSTDGTRVYVAVNDGYDTSGGYLCSANTANMMENGRVFLVDPATGNPASIYGDGTSTPTVGPDGDVYYGVLESSLGQHNARGWMLHFNSSLTSTKLPGSFGWDDTPSIVPASAVPSYTGTSTYLILTKYNNYVGVGNGNGENKVAILDPNNYELDPVNGTTHVMNEVLTVLGPTANPNGGVYEWCINAAAVDASNKQAVINSEDGHTYIWFFTTNTLSAGLLLANPTPEAYTCTVIGPDMAVYAINNAVLNCCVAGSTTSSR
jgi:hypothetical protein